MKLRFLCANHRSQLEGNVTKAIQFWQTGFDTGQFYRDHMLWPDALPHLGCAFETAEILLSKKMIEHEVACEWFSQSSLLLASTFANFQHRAEAEEVLWMTINRLERELANNGSESKWVIGYLSDQYLQLNNLLSAKAQFNQAPKLPQSKPQPLVLLH
ncbi:MAG: hypothetical protein P8P26_06160 [Porticoccaceae bacterium]|jgi:hypothetical protein|nr:hypothetical protein [Porticoccaceae bacterium]